MVRPSVEPRSYLDNRGLKFVRRPAAGSFCSNGTVVQVSRRSGVALAAVVAIVLLATVVAATSVARLLEVRGDGAAAERATDRASRAEAAATEDLAIQEAQRVAAEVRLATARDALAAVDEVLDAASHDRAAVHAQLVAAREELLALQEAVTGAAGEAFANAGLVNALADCLEGVSALVNQLAVGDRGGAVRTADAVAPACAAVGAAIG
jgi:hypothetical protein